MRQDDEVEFARPIHEPLRRVTIGAWAAELLPRASYETGYTPDVPVIGFAYEYQFGVHAFASGRRSGFCTKPNSLAYVPADCDVYSCSPAGGEYLTLRRIEMMSLQRLERRRFNDVVDPEAIGAAQKIRRLLLSSGRIDPLAFEHAAMTLADRVRCALVGGIEEPRAGTWMTGRRLTFVDEFVEANLDHALTVHQLAGALGLSAGFFSRAFKAAVGKAPHDYIVDRRLSRARALLCSRELGLSAIACASGFASHAHMSSVFHRRLGVAPSELRAVSASMLRRRPMTPRSSA